MKKTSGLGWWVALGLSCMACGGGKSGDNPGGAGGSAAGKTSSEAGTSAAGESTGGSAAGGGASGSAGSGGSGGGAAPCTANCPIDLMTDLEGPWGLAVGGGFAYVLLLSESTVMRVPLAGGAATRVTSVRYGSAGRDGLAIDGTSVYLTVSGGGTHTGVLKAPLAGGAATYLVQDVIQPEMLRIDAKNAYWTTQNVLSGVPITGGDPITIAEEAGTGFDRIALDSSYIYWAESGDFGNTSVKRAPLAGGGDIQTLAMNLRPVLDIEVDDTNVYINSYLDLLKIPIAGGDATPVATKVGSSFVLDGDNVYVAGETTIVKVPKSGGQPTTLATGQTRATSITVDDTSIYWLDQGSVLEPDGALRKLPK